MEASYISNNSFSVVDDRTSDFIKGRRVKLDCASDGIKYASVVSSTFSSITTVVVNENVLTPNLITVLYSSVKPGQEGNLPNHTHSTFEGDGGYITSPIFEFTELIDTPSTYSGTEGLFAKSTGSGIEFEEVVFSGTGGTSNVQTFLDLEDTPDVYSEGKFIKATSSGLEWTNGVIVDNKDKVLLTLDVGEYWACDLNSNMFDVGVSVSGTKALFRFDNNLNDDCGNNIITNNNLKFGIGKFGNCLTFDSSSTANGSLPSSIFYENESFCISVWINIKNQSNIYRGVFGIRNDTNTNSNFYFLVLQNTNDIEVVVGTSDGLYGLNYSHTAYMNSWAHVVFQHNSTTAEIWVNGTLINSVAITGSFDENTSKFMIGAEKEGTNNYCRDIDIDNMRILSSFLDEDAIISLYNEKILSHVDAATELANLITTSGIDITAFSMGYEVLVKSTISSKISASGIVNIYTEHLIGDLTFSNLLDTPSTYTEGQYLRTTTSGIEAINGIILKAPNQTEWLIGVTNSGILTTVEV